MAVECRGDLLIERRVWQQVTGQLLDDELIKRLIPVERFDHPIAPTPGAAVAVNLITIRVGVSSGVEPWRRHSLAVTRACEQTINDLLVCVRRFVVEEVVNLTRSRRQTRQI